MSEGKEFDLNGYKITVLPASLEELDAIMPSYMKWLLGTGQILHITYSPDHKEEREAFERILVAMTGGKTPLEELKRNISVSAQAVLQEAVEYFTGFNSIKAMFAMQMGKEGSQMVSSLEEGKEATA